MTLGAGSLTFRRIQVLQKNVHSVSEIVAMAEKLCIRPLDLDDVKEDALGFCHPFRGEPDLNDPISLVTEGCLVLGIRKDTKKVPGTLFKLQLKNALESLTRKSKVASAGQSQNNESSAAKRPRLSKAIREQAKDRIKQELLARTLPSIRLVEFVWNLETQEIWLMSTSDSVLADFEKLFNEAFQVPYCVLGPGTAALPFLKSFQGAPLNLDEHLNLNPVDFFGTGIETETTVGRSAASSEDSMRKGAHTSKSSDQEAPF